MTRLRRVLLTNDDGIAAPGLAVLAEIAADLADEVWIVAPETDRSGTSHSLSLHDPLRTIKLGERRFSVDGTPGDCAAIGLAHLLADAPPDLVLSGVNRGANLGVETVFSGTVGAAMTAMLLGVRAIALSQVFTGPNPVHWDCARRLGAEVIRDLLARGWPDDACLNVNFPDCPPGEARGLKITTQGNGLIDRVLVDARHDPRGRAYHWLNFRRDRGRADLPGSEVEAVRAGHVSVTPLRFERTHDEAFAALGGSGAPPRAPAGG